MAYWEPEGYHQMGEGEYAHITAGDVLARMLETAGLSSLAALAEWLGVRQALLTDAKRRNIVPIRWLQAMPHAHWVLSGKEKGAC